MKMPKTFHVQHAGRNKNRWQRNENGKLHLLPTRSRSLPFPPSFPLSICVYLQQSQTNKKLVVEKLLQLQPCSARKSKSKSKSSNRKKLCANVLMQKFVNVASGWQWGRGTLGLPYLGLTRGYLA